MTVFLSDQVEPDTVTTVCSVLSNRRRQLVVLFVLTCDDAEWVSMTDLARWITAVITNSSLDNVSGPKYRSVRESLRNTHLQALADADVINYDSQQTRVTPGEDLPLIGRIFLHLLLETTAPDAKPP